MLGAHFVDKNELGKINQRLLEVLQFNKVWTARNGKLYTPWRLVLWTCSWESQINSRSRYSKMFLFVYFIYSWTLFHLVFNLFLSNNLAQTTQSKHPKTVNLFFFFLISLKSNCEPSCCTTPHGKKIVCYHLFFSCIGVALLCSLHLRTQEFQALDVVTCILCSFCLQMNHKNV